MKLGRINVVTDLWIGSPEAVQDVVNQVLEQDGGDKVDVLLTPAGFLWAEIEEEKIERPSLDDQDMESFKKLKDRAEGEVRKLLLDDGYAEKLKSRTRYLALGIDVGLPINDQQKKGKRKGKICNNKSGIHAEFVVMIDLNNPGEKDHWTGKSYPSPEQKNKLYRYEDLASHCEEFATLGRTLILVCHDLNIYHHRADGLERKKKLTKERKALREQFRSSVENCKPNLVLHLYHSGWSSGTWTSAWNRLNEKVGSICSYVGCGVICRSEIKKKRTNLDDVIEKIKEKTKKNGLVVKDFNIKVN